MAHLETWAAARGFDELWVGASGAAGFYERCGWQPSETFTTSACQRLVVLHKTVT